MDIRAFFKDIEPLVDDGSAQLADTVRHLVYAHTPWVLEEVDFNDDRLFLNPLLFAAFTSGNVKRAPELLGVNTVAALAREEHFDPCPILRTKDFSTAEGQSIQITAHIDPDVNTVVGNDSARLLDAATLTRAHTNSPISLMFWHHELTEAWSVLEQATPELTKLLGKVTRTLLLFESSTLNSFASLSAHGLAGLNVSCETGLAYCLDDLAHQCGHIVFNAATSDTQRWLAVDARTPFAEISGDSADIRDVYAAFHGLFTYTCILSTLDLSSHLLSAYQAYLAQGRTAFYLNKFAHDCAILNQPKLYTEDGTVLFGYLSSACNYFLNRHNRLINQYALDNQPYNFCSRTFLNDNPQEESISQRLAEAAGDKLSHRSAVTATPHTVRAS